MITFNAVLQINFDNLDGLYRVVANPQHYSKVALFSLGTDTAHQAKEAPESVEAGAQAPPEKQRRLSWVERTQLDAAMKAESLRAIVIEPESALLQEAKDLEGKDLALYNERVKVMTPFIDHAAICDALLSPRRLGKLVRAAMNAHSCSRASVYRWWDLLCIHGFESGSLNPRFDRCGAPGTARPWQEGKAKVGAKPKDVRLGVFAVDPQVGVTAAARARVLGAYRTVKSAKLKGKKLYDAIIKTGFVTQYIATSNGREPVMPEPWTVPSPREVRYILDTGVDRIERAKARTTSGHFDRNLRGLSGYAWQDIAGPGHVFAMDSTIGDMYLRSSVNRAWIIGRPIVYIVVDAWSTAVTGFYVCLTGPSWATAKVALFSTFADPTLVGSLWGYTPTLALSPAPTVCWQLLTDRGEYLSQGAMATCRALGMNQAFNPAYRPDLKGFCEVLHRIAKDQQYMFEPGAINARRKELELRTDPKESAYTLREYVDYLEGVFTEYNLFSCRKHRLDDAMRAAGVHPSPAGLWRFGHEVGIGYRKETSLSRLIKTLLPAHELTVRKKGIFLGALHYEFERATQEQWSTLARLYGSKKLIGNIFPGGTQKIWWNDPEGAGCNELNLSPNALARGDLCLDEWIDSVAVSELSKRNREWERMTASIKRMTRDEDRRANAVKLTAEAEASSSDPAPTSSLARKMETHLGQPPQPEPVTHERPSLSDSASAYHNVMDELLSATANGVPA